MNLPHTRHVQENHPSNLKTISTMRTSPVQRRHVWRALIAAEHFVSASSRLLLPGTLGQKGTLEECFLNTQLALAHADGQTDAEFTSSRRYSPTSLRKG